MSLAAMASLTTASSRSRRERSNPARGLPAPADCARADGDWAAMTVTAATSAAANGARTRIWFGIGGRFISAASVTPGVRPGSDHIGEIPKWSDPGLTPLPPYERAGFGELR